MAMNEISCISCHNLKLLICQPWSRWEWDSGLPNNRSDSRPKKEKTQETVDRGALCRGNICTNALMHMHIYSLCPKQVANIALQDIEPRSEESADEVSESYGQQESDVLLWLWPMFFNVCSTLPPMVALKLLQHIYFPALCQHHFKETWSGTFPPRFFFHIKPVGYFTLG